MLIIINLFLYIRLREKASSNARGEATRRRRTSNLSLSSPSLSLSFSLVLSIHTHSFFSLSDVFCVDLLWLRTLFLFSLSYKPDRPHTTSANENEKEDKIAPRATSTNNGSPSATCATTFCAAWDASGETM